MLLKSHLKVWQEQARIARGWAHTFDDLKLGRAASLDLMAQLNGFKSWKEALKIVGK